MKSWESLRTFKGRFYWNVFYVITWFSKRHTFNPWVCNSCRYEAQCGYESKDEKEIADAWRREQKPE